MIFPPPHEMFLGLTSRGSWRNKLWTCVQLVTPLCLRKHWTPIHLNRSHSIQICFHWKGSETRPILQLDELCQTIENIRPLLFWRGCFTQSYLYWWTDLLEEASHHSFFFISQNCNSNTYHFSVAIGFAWACKNPYSFSGYTCIAATHTHTHAHTKQHIHVKM